MARGPYLSSILVELWRKGKYLMMSSWYILSIVALLFMGTQRFFYKVSAEKNCNTAWTTFSFMATVTLVSSLLFIISGASVSNLGFLLFISFLNSSAFVIGTYTHIEALKHIPVSAAYPIIRLNTVIVVVFSILFFNDHLSFFQVIGIVMAMAVITILTRQIDIHDPSYRNTRRGLVLVFISLFCGSIATISSKFAAMYTNKMGFMAISYLIGTLLSFGLAKNVTTKDASANHTQALIIGFIMGLINVIGFYAFLRALAIGPLSIIVSITGMHFVIAILLSALIYKEKLTTQRVVGITLTILAIIFLRL